MNEVLRYEEVIQSQLALLPLPDENFAWQEMKKLLEEDDDEAFVVPPPVRKGCAGIALLLLAGLVAGWFLLKPLRWFGSSAADKTEPVHQTEQKQNQKQEAAGQKKTVTLRIEDTATIQDVSAAPLLPEQKDSNLLIPAGHDRQSQHKIDVTGKAASANAETLFRQSVPAVNKKTIATSAQQKAEANQKTEKQAGRMQVKARQPAVYKKTAAASPQDENGISAVISPQQPATEITKTKAAGKEQPSAVVPSIPAGSAPVTPGAKTDSTQTAVITKKDTAAVKDPAASPVTSSSANETKKADNDKKFWFSTGLGLTHQLPLGSQSATPYNYYGRKGSLADYIPSVYARLHREQKWFVQGEFRYGAPQYTREFLYDNNVLRTDTFGTPLSTSSYRLKKTFYHQLPLSFHYVIRPGFTAGTGIVYNKFFGAVSDEEIRNRIPGTNIDSIVSKKLVYSTAKTDSSFEKSNLQWLVEMQYQWRRFTIGARYSLGLQPYIRFTDPTTGLLREEKNQNLNLFLKVELWNSKKKK